jgi:type VI secretion system secreted protein Hcp
MGKFMAACVTAMLLCASMPAQNGQGNGRTRSSITMKVDGVKCSTSEGTDAFEVLSWSFGATQSATTGTGSGGGAGKANVGDLSAQKMFDACSPELFGAVVTGKHFTTVTLDQQDRQQNSVMKIVLSDVLVSSFQLGGTESKEIPSETVSFNFAKICISDPASSKQLCFNKATNKIQ